MNNRGIKYLLHLIAYLIPVKKNRIYMRSMGNCAIDKYDMINFGSSNLLCLFNALLRTDDFANYEVCINYFDNNRKEKYEEYLSSFKNKKINIHMVYTGKASKLTDKIKITIRQLKILYSSKFVLIETGDIGLFTKNNQTIICTNYFISCKNDYFPNLKARWSFIDCLITTAMLPSQIISCQNGVDYGNCKVTGFPRNDTLFSSERFGYIDRWIVNTLGHKPRFVFVYAPTYRDYDKLSNDDSLLFGYECKLIDRILEKNDAIIIVKTHPLHHLSETVSSNRIIKYESTYDFSLYDLLSYSHCLIGDYSSVMFDYLLTKKPMIYNLYDYEKYNKVRGLSYDPYEFFCPGHIVRNEEELSFAVLDVINGVDQYSDQRDIIVKLIHKYCDNGSSKRVMDLFHNYLYN